MNHNEIVSPHVKELLDAIVGIVPTPHEKRKASIPNFMRGTTYNLSKGLTGWEPGFVPNNDQQAPQTKPQRQPDPTVQHVEDVTQTKWYKEAFKHAQGERGVNQQREDYEEFVRELNNQVGGGV